MNNITLSKRNNYIYINNTYKYDTSKKCYKKGIIDRCIKLTRCDRSIVKQFVDNFLLKEKDDYTPQDTSILNKILLELKLIGNRITNIENKLDINPINPNEGVYPINEGVSSINEKSEGEKLINPINPNEGVYPINEGVSSISEESEGEKLINPINPNNEVTPFNIPIENFQGMMKEIVANMEILKEIIDEKTEENNLENLLNEDELGYEPIYMKQVEEREENEEDIPNVLLGPNQIPCYYKENLNYTELYHKGKKIGHVEPAGFDMEYIDYEYPIKGGQSGEVIILKNGLFRHKEDRNIPIFFIDKDPSIWKLLGEYHKDFITFPCYCEYNVKPSRYIDFQNFEYDYKNSLGLFFSCDETLISYI